MIENEEAREWSVSDDEALRLVLAFYCIMEPEKRIEVLDLAQRYAIAQETAQGITELYSPGSH